MRPVLVCIAGGSASGKSTLAQMLVERLDDLSCGIIHQDNYFRDWAEEQDLRSANRPDAVLWPALLADLDSILSGEPARLPASGTRSAARGADAWDVAPRDVLVVEG